MLSKMKFVGVSLVGLVLPAIANAEGMEGTASNGGYIAIAAAIAIGLAAFGGALGQGKAASSALEGMARNPQASLLTPLILGLALIESLVIYALVIAFMLVGKV